MSGRRRQKVLDRMVKTVTNQNGDTPKRRQEQCVERSLRGQRIDARYDSVIGLMLWCAANGLIGRLLILSTAHCHISNTYFRQHFLNNITDAQRQSELFMHELLDLREHSSILTNGRGL